MPPDHLASTNIEALKIELEREKLTLERERLAVEQYKARWSAFSVAVPLLALAATVGLGIWNQYKSSSDQFALKAAEIIMATDNPNVTHNKAKALATLFPEKLPSNFAVRFNADKIPDDPDASRRALFTLVTANPTKAYELMRLWTLIYPGDKWVEELAAKMAPNPSIERTHNGGPQLRAPSRPAAP